MSGGLSVTSIDSEISKGRRKVRKEKERDRNGQSRGRGKRKCYENKRKTVRVNREGENVEWRDS